MVAFLDDGDDESYVQILQEIQIQIMILLFIKEPKVNYNDSSYLTVPSKEALAILAPEAEKWHRLIGLVCPKNVSFK
jgi:hypothetical protein